MKKEPAPGETVSCRAESWAAPLTRTQLLWAGPEAAFAARPGRGHAVPHVPLHAPEARSCGIGTQAATSGV